MTALSLLSLGERVEKAMGPVRELDFLIAEALSENKDHWEGCRQRQVRWFDMSDWKAGDPIPVTWEWSQPLYTASIDAAMSLVPDGLSFEVRSSGIGDKGQATIWDPMTQPGLSSHRQWNVKGCHSPALALCAAALKARASMVEGEK